VIGGAIGASLSSKIREDLIDPTFRQPVPEFSSTLVVPPSALQVGKTSLALSPRLSEHTFQYRLN
jgi:hypothetical protein